MTGAEFAKKKEDLDARRSSTRETLERLESTPVVDPEAQRAANLAIERAVKLKEDIRAVVARLKADLSDFL